MMYDLLAMKGKGINWAKNLPNYCRVLNQEAKEELGWLSLFEVFYGQKSNVVTKASLEHYDIDSCPSESLKNTPKGKTCRNKGLLLKTLGKGPSLITKSWRNR